MRRSIELTEFQPKVLRKHELSAAEAFEIYQRYGEQVEVEFPSPKTGNKYQLKPKGWVGYIPLGRELGLHIAPKVPLRNLFGMWELAYGLDFRFLDGLMGCESLGEYYERLAMVLAQKVIDRTRKGLYRAYKDQEESLPYVRGRIDVIRNLTRHGKVTLPCRFQEHTADVIENRLLAWTLYKIIFSGLCSNRSLPTLHKSFRGIRHLAGAEPCSLHDSASVLYTRLNEDYRSLHALCRFFLEQTGPSHRIGDKKMLPFLADMANLFELFVSQWMKRHIGKEYLVKKQKTMIPQGVTDYYFRADIIIYNAANEEPVCVVDTKYKNNSTPDQTDISQVVTYAELAGCCQAVLVYPVAIEAPLKMKIGNIVVSNASFDLAGDLDAMGIALLEYILPHIAQSVLDKQT